MSGLAGSALGLWLALAALSVATWLPSGGRPWQRWLTGRAGRVGLLVVLGTGTAGVAVMAGLAPSLSGPWAWLVAAVAGTAALLTGGSITTSVLGLAERRPASGRVQPDILRGGAWIGALERLGTVATLLAGWPEGIAAIIAIKGLARFPELRLSLSTGAVERFIVGTFVSLGWAAACAGVATALLR